MLLKTAFISPTPPTGQQSFCIVLQHSQCLLRDIRSDRKMTCQAFLLRLRRLVRTHMPVGYLFRRKYAHNQNRYKRRVSEHMPPAMHQQRIFHSGNQCQNGYNHDVKSQIHIPNDTRFDRMYKYNRVLCIGTVFLLLQILAFLHFLLLQTLGLNILLTVHFPFLVENSQCLCFSRHLRPYHSLLPQVISCIFLNARTQHTMLSACP
nr:MAG TPA: hypothetical protein [Bacteriophage sp.]